MKLLLVLFAVVALATVEATGKHGHTGRNETGNDSDSGKHANRGKRENDMGKRDSDMRKRDGDMGKRDGDMGKWDGEMSRDGGMGPSRSMVLRRWSSTKVYEKCLGETRMPAERDWLKTNLRQCQSQPHPQPIHEMMTNTLNAYNRSITNMTKVQQREHEMIRRTFHHLGNYTCILRAIKFVDNENIIQIGEIKSHVEKLTDDVELRNGLKEDADDCFELSKCAPKRLLSNVMKHYMFLHEGHIRQAIFFQCFRARMMHTCVHKERTQQSKVADPQMALAIARIPRLDDEENIFADLFAPMKGEGAWFSMFG